MAYYFLIFTLFYSYYNESKNLSSKSSPLERKVILLFLITLKFYNCIQISCYNKIYLHYPNS